MFLPSVATPRDKMDLFPDPAAALAISVKHERGVDYRK